MICGSGGASKGTGRYGRRATTFSGSSPNGALSHTCRPFSSYGTDRVQAPVQGRQQKHIRAVKLARNSHASGARLKTCRAPRCSRQLIHIRPHRDPPKKQPRNLVCVHLHQKSLAAPVSLLPVRALSHSHNPTKNPPTKQQRNLMATEGMLQRPRLPRTACRQCCYIARMGRRPKKTAKKSGDG